MHPPAYTYSPAQHLECIFEVFLYMKISKQQSSVTASILKSGHSILNSLHQSLESLHQSLKLLHPILKSLKSKPQIIASNKLTKFIKSNTQTTSEAKIHATSMSQCIKDFKHCNQITVSWSQVIETKT